MASILIVLSSSPGSSLGERALTLAESLSRAGHALTLCCLQDAALLASTRAPGVARAALDAMRQRGARCLVSAEDLEMRGLRASDGISATDHSGVVALLAGAHDRVIGAL